jgi:membrane associated rhomboid family serine protease
MRATFATILITTLVFILQIGGFVSTSQFGFTPSEVYQKPYILITSLFLHANLYHLLANMLGLFVFGIIVEEAIGSKKWILLYLTSGVIGNIGYMLLSNPFIPAIGASGAIFGLMGAAAILKPKQIVFTQFGPFPMFIAAIIWTITEIISFFGVDNIAQSAHIFGIIGGMLVTLLLKKENTDMLLLISLIISIVLLYLISLWVPHEINTISVNCEKTNIGDLPNFKETLYNCSNKILLVISKPAIGKLNPADYYNSFPDITKRLYETTYKQRCNPSVQKFYTQNDEIISEGKICNYHFKNIVRKCGYSQIAVIQLFNDTPVLNDINCSF